jgi:glycerophosphoryl diester phosphodiesterase
MKLKRSQVITHRGLDPSRKNFFSESSFEAFSNLLERGFGGIEFDPNFAKDGIVVLHDATLERVTKGLDKRPVAQVSVEELLRIKLPHGTIPTLAQVMELIRKHPASTINALHLKSRFQTPENITRLLAALDPFGDVISRIIIFDVKAETARILKSKNPKLRLAPSVAHPYDIERYNQAVGGTLLSIEESLKLKEEGIIEGVWADEWDRTDKNGATKTFYNSENFNRLKKAGLFIALVTPELHATSPGLYGGESHQDARNHNILMQRIKQILAAGADYVCTDYPDEVASLEYSPF